MRMRRLLLVPLLLVAATAQAGEKPRSPKDICDELPRRVIETPLAVECDWVCQAARFETDYIRWDPCCGGGFVPYAFGNGAASAATASVFWGGCD